MPLYYPEKLKIGNVDRLGIVDEKEVSGTRSVKTLEDLYSIPDPILSPSKLNDGAGSLGQEWYVEDEAKWYRLVSWNNRKIVDGWKVCDPLDIVSYINVDKNAEIEYNVNCEVGDRTKSFDSHASIYGFMTKPYAFVEYETTPPYLTITSITLKSPPSSIRQSPLTNVEKTAFRPHFWVAENETAGIWRLIGCAVDAKGFTALDETLTWDNIVVENIAPNSTLFVSFCTNASGEIPTEILFDTVPLALQVRPPNTMDIGGSQIEAEYMVNSADGSTIIRNWVPECDMNFNYHISKVSVELSNEAQAESENSLQTRSQISNLVDSKLDVINSKLDDKQNSIITGPGLIMVADNLRINNSASVSGLKFDEVGAVYVDLANFSSTKPSEDTVTKVVYDESGQLAVPHAETMSSDTGLVTPELITDTYPYLNDLNKDNAGYSGDETPITFANYDVSGSFGNWNNFGGFRFNLAETITEIAKASATTVKINGIVVHMATNRDQGLNTPFYLNVFTKPKDAADTEYQWIGATTESYVLTTMGQELTVNFDGGIIIDPKTDTVLITFASTNTPLESYLDHILMFSFQTYGKLNNYSAALRNTDGGSNWQFSTNDDGYALVMDIMYSLPSKDVLVSDLPIVINSKAVSDNEVPNLGQTKSEILKSLNGCTLWTGTQAEYDALVTKGDNTIYFIVEG